MISASVAIRSETRTSHSVRPGSAFPRSCSSSSGVSRPSRDWASHSSGNAVTAMRLLQAMGAGVPVQYRGSQNVPKIARYIEGDAEVTRLDAIACFDAKHTQPFGTYAQCHARARRGNPGGGNHIDLAAGPSGGDERRECNGAGCARRSCRQPQKWHRRAPLEVNECLGPAAPLPKLVTDERPVTADDERTMRRQMGGRDAEV